MAWQQASGSDLNQLAGKLSNTAKLPRSYAPGLFCAEPHGRPNQRDEAGSRLERAMQFRWRFSL